jgi:hypothetical protein
MNEFENLDSSKVFMLNDDMIAEAFLEYYNDVPFINIYVDLSIDVYVRLKKWSDTISIFKNLSSGVVKSLIKHGFACNDSGAVQLRIHLN